LIDVTKKLSTAILVISFVCGIVAGQKKNQRPPVAYQTSFVAQILHGQLIKRRLVI
jgi:hypothetical protein